MIIAALYLLIILFFIYKNGFFGIFIDKSISPFQFTLFFFIKCLAIPTFYYVYLVKYGGIAEYDAGIFLKDSKIINSIFYDDPLAYVKLMLGFGNDAVDTEVYDRFISQTRNWDEGRSWRLFFNDNRSLIRIHSIIHFISFGSYFVHALISCLCSYIGIGLMYRTLKLYFISKELWLFAAMVILPNTWFFSGALLKEPLVILNIGLSIFLIDKIFDPKYSILRKTLYFVFILFIAYYLKPQIGITISLLYFIYKLIKATRLRSKGIWYMVALGAVMILVNFSFIIFKNVSMFSLINNKKAEFYDVAKGGVFLKDENKFVRVENDPLNFKKIDQQTMRINLGVPYYYWKDSNQKDTLFCVSNTDTITKYHHVYSIDVAHSGYAISDLRTDESAAITILHSLIRSLGYPYKLSDGMNALISIESLLLSICFIFSLIGLFFIKDRSLPLFLILSSVLLLILFGIATPNHGAIIRYRSVIAPFMVMAFLYMINHYEPPTMRERDN